MKRLSSIFLCLFSAQVFAAKFVGYETETWIGSRGKDGIYVFKGIPFAKPPVGNLRWAPTEPYAPGYGQKKATNFGPACMKADHIENWYRDLIKKLEQNPGDFEGPATSSEDCLYMNIWTPSRQRDANLPVMVWIHGGSNESGWAFEPDYRGGKLAQNNVVVISVAYRLGAFSMFAHPELIEEQGGTAANYGLLDLLTALEWIQDYATHFGGNPNNVTLFGESAGAENIAALMASPRATSLFHKAIHQSGPEMSTHTLDDVATWSNQLSAKRTLAEMRALSAEDIYQLQNSNPPSMGYAPTAAGHGLEPGNLYEAIDPRPLIIGVNANEWLMYLPEQFELEAYLSDLSSPFSAAEFRRRYPDLTDRQIADRVATATYMYCGSIKLADIVADSEKAYFYSFDRIRAGEFGSRVGAYHGAEIPYVFNNHAYYLITKEHDVKLSEQMMGYWTSFAREGVPGHPWPRYNADSRQVFHLGKSSSAKTAHDLFLCQ